MSLNSSAENPCRRSYIPKSFGRKAWSAIELNITSNQITPNSSLVFLHADDDRFMSVEMVDRKIRFVWNLGGATTSITNPMIIHSNETWYNIDAQTILNRGTLVVSEINQSGIYVNSHKVFANNHPEFNIFNLSKNSSRIWVGGIPAKMTRHSENLVSAGLHMVIDKLRVDRQSIGLWNSEVSKGECSGAVSGPKPPEIESNVNYFIGDGYARTGKISSKPYDKRFFSIQLSFKTLDENALIFLAIDEEKVCMKCFIF